MALLIVERGVDKGKKVELKQNRVIVVGRSSEADLVVNDPMASRKHFEVEGRDGRFYIRDASSTNGTYLNGELLTEERELEIGDKIEVGLTILSFMPHSGWSKKDTITGQNIAGYLIIERIGRGGMGTVYKALQLSLDRAVALKILSKELCRDTEFIEMFVREARNAGQLNHPNIVHVYDVGKFNEIYYLSMEYMANGSVADLLRKQKRVKVRHAIPMMIDATKGLEYAERKGLVHRDIKPDNLLMNDEGVVKIGDLGIAKRVGFGSGVQEEGIFGSPLYMAPEQAKCEKVDHRADIYSLGASFYHILAGRPLFEGKTPQEILLKQINEEPPPLKSVASDVPDEVCEIVEKMLRKDVKKRYQSASEVLADLEATKKRLRSVRRYRAPRMSRKQLLIAIGTGVAIIVVLLLVALALYLYERSREDYRKRYSALNSTIQSAEEFATNGRYDDALKCLDEALKKFQKQSDLQPLILKAETLKKRICELKEEKRRLDMEMKAASELEAVEKFYSSHPDAYSEVLKLFRHITENYPGTEAAKKAEEYIKEVRAKEKEVEERFKNAQMEADRLIRAARVLAQEGRFRRAFALLDEFPKEFSDTPAHTGIEEYRKRVVQMQEEAFLRLRQRVRHLTRRGKFSDAEALIERTREYYGENKKRDFDSLAAEVQQAVRKHEQQVKEMLLKEDRKRFLDYFKQTQASFSEFDFDSADARLSSLLLLLKTEEYEKVTETMKELLLLASRLHSRLITQINEKSLLRPVRLMVGRIEADVCAADQQTVTVRYTQLGAEVRSKRKWQSLPVQQMVSIYSAMRLDTDDILGIGAFLILRGAEGADEWFDRALKADPSSAERVKRFKESKKWLK